MSEVHHDLWHNKPWPYKVGGIVLFVVLASFEIDWGERGFLGWTETHAGLAAWVQSGGTLFALGIAIGVPWFLHSREIQERKTDRALQAQGIALLIRPSLVVLKGKLDRELRMVREGAAPHEFRAVKVPETITGQIDQLWMMGVAGGHTLQLVSTLDADDQNLAEFTHYMNGAEQAPITISKMLRARAKTLDFALDDTNDALAQIETLLAA